MLFRHRILFSSRQIPLRLTAPVNRLIDRRKKTRQKKRFSCSGKNASQGIYRLSSFSYCIQPSFSPLLERATACECLPGRTRPFSLGTASRAAFLDSQAFPLDPPRSLRDPSSHLPFGTKPDNQRREKPPYLYEILRRPCARDVYVTIGESRGEGAM